MSSLAGGGLAGRLCSCAWVAVEVPGSCVKLCVEESGAQSTLQLPGVPASSDIPHGLCNGSQKVHCTSV